MLYEYAILPDVFRANLLEKRPSARRELKRLLYDLCEKNGLLADLHNGYWHTYVKEKMLPHLDATTSADIRACLKNLEMRNRLVCRRPYSEGRPDDHLDWLDEALDADQSDKLSGIVLSQTLMAKYALDYPQFYDLHSPLFMELGDALDSPHWTNRQETLDVETSVQGYRTVLSPILKYAKTLDIIDPHINCDWRFRQFVELCAGLLGSQRATRATRRISIHVGEPYDYQCQSPIEQRGRIEQRQKEWQEYLSDLLRSNSMLRFRVFLWSAKETSQRFHDRYLLTDQCGLSLGYGTEVRPGNTSTWAFLNENVRTNQLARFQPGDSPFKLLLNHPLIVETP